MRTLDIFNDIEDINEEEIKKDKDYGYLKISNKKKELIKESLAHNINPLLFLDTRFSDTQAEALVEVLKENPDRVDLANPILTAEQIKVLAQDVKVDEELYLENTNLFDEDIAFCVKKGIHYNPLIKDLSDRINYLKEHRFFYEFLNPLLENWDECSLDYLSDEDAKCYLSPNKSPLIRKENNIAFSIGLSYKELSDYISEPTRIFSEFFNYLQLPIIVTSEEVANELYDIIEKKQVIIVKDEMQDCELLNILLANPAVQEVTADMINGKFVSAYNCSKCFCNNIYNQLHIH